MAFKNNIKTDVHIKPIRMADFVLVFALLGIVACFVVNSFFMKSDSLFLSVKKDGKIVYKQDLEEVESPYEYTVEGELSIVLSIENDGVTIINAQCPDKLCQKSGKLTKKGQTAICLPAKVSVEIENYNNKTDLDGVAG